MTTLITSCAPALLLTASALAQLPYGVGTPGSGGFTPRLSCNQPWHGRDSFAVQVGEGLGGAPGFVALGLAPIQQSYAGLPLLVDPMETRSTLFVVLGGNGAGQGTTSIPVSLAGVAPSWVGLEFYAQAAFADPQGPGLGGGWTATAGLEMEITATPQIFASIGGTYAAVNGQSLAVELSGSTPFAIGFELGAAYSNDGQDLYVASVPTPTGGTVQLAHADLRSGAPTWSLLNFGVGSASGWIDGTCHMDHARQLLWIAGGGSNPRLWAVDVDRASASFGQAVVQLAVGNIGFMPRAWAMSPDRKLAALVGTGPNAILTLIDTDAGSPTYLQVVASAPPFTNGPFWPGSVDFSADGRHCLVLGGPGTMLLPGELARYDIASGQWIDHDPTTPAIDNIGPNSVPPIDLGAAGQLVNFDVGPDGALWFCGPVVGPGGSGYWAGRLTINGLTPSMTPLNPTSSLDGARFLALDRDGSRLAIASITSIALLLFDTRTLNEIGSVSGVPATRNLAWR